MIHDLSEEHSKAHDLTSVSYQCVSSGTLGTDLRFILLGIEQKQFARFNFKDFFKFSYFPATRLRSLKSGMVWI